MSLTPHTNFAKPSAKLRQLLMNSMLATSLICIAPLAALGASPQSSGLQFAQVDAPAAKVAKAATEGKAETVEERITMLHTKLAITADEETAWSDVAKAMRENAAAMDLLVSDRATVDPKTMTALDDLLTYQKFTQAHVDGLKNLISAFTTLYTAMPDGQKKVADEIFASFNHKHEHGHEHT